MRLAYEIFQTGENPLIALLPGGVQGPAQGPNIPIKRYGDTYMPDATQPTGYRPGPVAMSPVVPVLNIIRDAVEGRPAADGTLDGAYMQGAPGVVKPLTPDTVRPADSDIQYMQIMNSGAV